MRTIVVSLLAIVLAALVILAGCSDLETSPRISRIVLSESCGIVPLDVEFLAIVTGGNQGTDPTGANMWYEITWDFGDGTTTSGSKVYHTYTDIGTYEVSVVGRDADGKEAPATATVSVYIDSLTIVPDPDPVSGTTIVAGRDTVELGILAEFCGLDPEVDEQYSRFTIEWIPPNGTAVYGQRVPFVFLASLVGTQWIQVRVTDPALSLTRRDSISYVLQEPPSRFLDFHLDMSNIGAISPDGVHVTGSFNGWDPSQTPLTDPDGDEIYFARVEVDRDTSHQFRFLNGLTDGDENVPSDCRVDGGVNGFVREVDVVIDDVPYSTEFGECP